ncbi:hypothetical protein SAVCW2_58030 [Streptomyces avermitilis]|nr:hypothetical protein SAVCW2_58030 [Streptomyces avermitilis]
MTPPASAHADSPRRTLSYAWCTATRAEDCAESTTTLGPDSPRKKEIRFARTPRWSEDRVKLSIAPAPWSRTRPA